MGKNNRCKGKKRKPQGAKQFSITATEMKDAEKELNNIVKARADEIAMRHVHDANWILSIMNEYILVHTYRFSAKMLTRFIEERRNLVRNVENDEKISADLIRMMYNGIEDVVGKETMLEWFGECPDFDEL